MVERIFWRGLDSVRPTGVISANWLDYCGKHNEARRKHIAGVAKIIINYFIAVHQYYASTFFALPVTLNT